MQKNYKLNCYNPYIAAPLALKIGILIPYVTLLISFILYIYFVINHIIRKEKIWDKKLKIITIVLIISFILCYYLTFFTEALRYIDSLLIQPIDNGSDIIVPAC